MSAVLWSRSGSFEFTAAGVPATGALAYFFDSGTSTPRTVYQDSALATPHAHPLAADGNGRWPAVYLPFGDYKYTLKTSGGTTLISIDGISNDEPTDPTDTVDPNAIFQTGDIILAGANATRAGFVRWNARSIGSATSSATERANADCEAAFLYLWNNFLDAQCPVSGGRGASAAADWAANKRITLPDCRSTALVGFDDMGNTAAAYGDPPITTGSRILAGSIVGLNTHTLVTSQLPVHAHTVSITSAAGSAHTHGLGTLATVGAGAHTHTGTTTSDGAHTHTVGNPGDLFQTLVASGGVATLSGAGLNESSAAATNSNGAHTHTFASTSDPGNHTHTFSGALANESAHTHLVSGNTGNVGSDFAHNIMQRSALVKIGRAHV